MSPKKVILILGAGIMQIPAITKAKEKGWYVAVADADDRAAGRPLADRFDRVDLKDEEGMVRLAKILKSETGLDGVFTAGTDFSATVAKVAEVCGLPGIPYETALNASNKARMRSVFSRRAIPSPSFFECTRELFQNEKTIEQIVHAVEFPAVVKPVDNMGARGIRRVDTVDELVPALSEAIRSSKSGTAIVEEYMDGAEYSLDALIYNGEITLTGLADRYICYPPYFVEMGHTIPANGSESTLAEVTGLFFKGIEALGLTMGAAKGDMKMTSKGPMVGEIAARLSGGFMSGWTYPYCSGVDLTGAALNIAVGHPPGDLSPRWDKVSSERAFISIPGIVDEIVGTDKAETLPDVEELFVRCEAGSEVVFPRNNVEKCGNVIAVSSSRNMAETRSGEACASIIVRLSPAERSTLEFLLRGAEKWAPDAFSLEIPENRNAFEKMPWFGPSVLAAVTEPVTVAALPDAGGERDVDWNGRTLRETVLLLEKVGGIRFVDAMGPFIGGRAFWRTVIRGGVQGGLWFADTVRYCVRHNRSPEELFQP